MIDKRCKLLGLYTPTKIAPTNPEGDVEYQEGFYRDQLIAKFDAIVQRRKEAEERAAAEATTEENAATGRVGSQAAPPVVGTPEPVALREFC